MYFTINNKDFSYLVSSLKVGYETLVSSDSGRNANGDTVIDIINRKYKVYIGFRYMTNTEMKTLLEAISNYVVTIGFMNPNTNTMTQIQCYTGTPEPDAYTIQKGLVLYKPMSLNFIQL